MTYGFWRRAVQLGTFLFMFLVPILNVYEIYSLTGTFYAINIGKLGIADPVVILQAIFAAGELTTPLLSAAIFPVILAFVFGRIWCGWMCPYHFLSDMIALLRKKIGRTEPGTFRPSFQANIVRFSFLLVGTATAGALGIPILNYFSAPGIVSTEAMIIVKERIPSIELSFVALLLTIESILLPRFWCRFFCPTGAFVSLFKTPYTLRIALATQRPKSPCCKENHCSKACPMGLNPYREGNNLLCTNCSLCIDACPSKRLYFKGFTGN